MAIAPSAVELILDLEDSVLPAEKAESRGSFEMDGKLIEIPIVTRAERPIARAVRIAARGSM